MMSLVWDKIEALAKHLESKFDATGEPIKSAAVDDYKWHNQLWSAPI